MKIALFYNAREYPWCTLYF